jgi:hypothetical protein
MDQRAPRPIRPRSRQAPTFFSLGTLNQFVGWPSGLVLPTPDQHAAPLAIRNAGVGDRSLYPLDPVDRSAITGELAVGTDCDLRHAAQYGLIARRIQCAQRGINDYRDQSVWPCNPDSEKAASWPALGPRLALGVDSSAAILLNWSGNSAVYDGRSTTKKTDNEKADNGEETS